MTFLLAKHTYPIVLSSWLNVAAFGGMLIYALRSQLCSMRSAVPIAHQMRSVAHGTGKEMLLLVGGV